MRTYSKNERLISVRRAHIAECATRVIIKKGYDATSVPDISEACNMSIGALYRYIGSKEDILYLVIEQGIEREMAFYRKTFRRARSLSPVEAVKFAMGELIKSLDEIQDFILFSYRTKQDMEPSARQDIHDVDIFVSNEFEKLLFSGCKKGVFEIDNVRMLAHTIVAVAQMWALRRWAFRDFCTLNEYIEFYTNLILKQICKEPYKSD